MKLLLQHHSADNNNIILSTNLISNDVDNSVVISEVPKYFYLFYSIMWLSKPQCSSQ